MNLMYVTGSAKNQNVRLVFEVTEVASGLAKTRVKEYQQIPYYLGRFVKQGSELIEDSFTVTGKDGSKVLVKPFMVAKGKVSGLVAGIMRKRLRELVEKELAEKESSEFISAVISSKIQNLLRNEVKKIYPLKVLEFKKIMVE